MHVIDCDAHVEESEATWQYLDPAFYPMRPLPIVFPEDTCFGTHNAAWVIDYKLRFFGANPTAMRRAQEKGVPIPVQELTDVAARLASMDEIGVDTQVIFPSIWLGCLAENVELEAALARTYNTYMATQCGLSGGRIWYAAIVPFRRPDLAVAELRRVATLGSVAGVFTLGIEWDMPLSHPSFWPIYEEAERLSLPLLVHTGNGSSPAISRMLEGVPRPYLDDFPHIHPLGTGLVSNPYVLYGAQQILGSSMLEDFPRLRVAFLEAGTEWAVRTVKSLRRRKGAKIDQWLGERVFASCQSEEDLPYVASQLGDDFLITATDFPHGDAFRQDRLENDLQQRGDLSYTTIEKILTGNPLRLMPMLAPVGAR